MKPVLVAPGMSAVMADCSCGETVSPTDPLTGTGKHGGGGSVQGTPVRITAWSIWGPQSRFSGAGTSQPGAARSHGPSGNAYDIDCIPDSGTCFQVSNDGMYVDIWEAALIGGPNGQTFTLQRVTN
jgi:hypothetical protein